MQGGTGRVDQIIRRQKKRYIYLLWPLGTLPIFRGRFAGTILLKFLGLLYMCMLNIFIKTKNKTKIKQKNMDFVYSTLRIPLFFFNSALNVSKN
jgi:hypothetical protein